MSRSFTSQEVSDLLENLSRKFVNESKDCTGYAAFTGFAKAHLWGLLTGLSSQEETFKQMQERLANPLEY
jgi:hypothetical protein